MLRFHLTTEDLLRVRLAARPHPIWEISFSLQLLQTREAVLLFDPWRRTVRRALAREGLTQAITELARLYPPADYWPDFLVPGVGLADVESGLDLVMATPRSELRRELTLMAHYHGALPPWTRTMAEGDITTLKRLGELLRRYHRIAVAPYTGQLQNAFRAERAHRADIVLSHGAEELLPSYSSPLMNWHEGVLNVVSSVDEEFRTEGRAMTLLPSFFCLNHPTALADHERPLTLAYPLPHTVGWLSPPHTDATTQPCDARAALARLIGPARAATLDALDRAMTTSQLALALGLSVPSASRHAATLRDVGLVGSERRGQSVLHTRTPMGTALLEGHPPAASPPSAPAVPRRAAQWAYARER
ncbi:ArsR/SmtB family transcription factor [Streptomyces sp. NPDC088789]|uniref:ArsR/SmtB family transcription factor n=1 Tax=Streptomyces sp. NPDC088789 TaxID=3365899 RepID=UPI0037F1744C